MARHAVVLVSVLLLFGCDKRAALEARQLPAAAEAPAAAGAARPSEAANGRKYLAYEHTIAIDADNEKVAPLFEAAQAACRDAAAEACDILEARITRSDSSQSAALKFRAKPEGIKKLIAVVSGMGKVSTSSTKAEDLAGPIADTTKQLSMLTDYRTRLEALRVRATDIDSMIKLNHELADVQGRIEGLAGAQSHLMQRVDTEILNVSISSYRNPSFWSPIGESFSGFGNELSDGIATVITGLAYIIPWGLVVALIVWGLRKLWKGRKRKPAE